MSLIDDLRKLRDCLKRLEDASSTGEADEISLDLHMLAGSVTIDAALDKLDQDGKIAS